MSENQEEDRCCVYNIQNRDQVELLTDPLGLPILVAMERDKWISPRELSEELGENKELLEDYLSSMYDNGMLEKKVVDEVEKYRKKAVFYSVGKMFPDLPDPVDDHWIFGIIQHLKGDFRDMLNLLQESKNLTEGFEKVGYPGDKSLDFLIRKLHLSEDQLDDFNEELRDLINKYNDQESENKNDYDVTLFLKPYLPSLRNACQNEEEKV